MISVVIPMYNEESIAEESMRTLCSAMDKMFKDGYEVVVSDDGSTDRTAETVRGLAGELPHLRLTSYPDNRGKGSAVREGILATVGDVVLYTDCDLAYGTDMIGTMEAKLRADGSDAVLGSRNLSADGYAGYTFLRRLASKIYIKVLCIAAGFRHSDSQCGIKCFRGDVAREVFSKCQINSFAFDLEALMVAEHFGYRVTEQAVTIINHRESTSKVHLVKDTLKMLRDIRGIKKRLKTMK